MARFIVKRVLAAMLTLLIIATITFFLMNMIPGGPFNTERASATTVEMMEAKYGLDKPLLEQFGLVYYGCCEPLHNRIDYIRKIKNVRKISMSPWADIRAGAEHIHGDYVISRKPNPAYLAAASFDPELVRRELQETCRAAKENGCTCELILKDVSTVQYHPERLAQWHKIAVEVAGEW